MIKIDSPSCVFSKSPWVAIAEIIPDALKENQCEGSLRLDAGLKNGRRQTLAPPIPRRFIRASHPLT